MARPRTPGPGDGCAWVTGASSGIGRATAARLAEEGWTVIVSARSADKLEALAAEDHAPGRILAWPLDVTDEAAVKHAVADIESEQGPIALALLNAGTYWADSATTFKASSYAKTHAVNIIGTVNCLEPVMHAMRMRGWGHIAMTGSVSGYGGLPMALAYGSSKAAMINLAEALRMECAPLGIKIQIINPGFIETELTDKNRFPMPFLMPLDKAVTKLVSGLKKDRFEIVFPWQLAFILKRMRAWPYGLYFAAMSRITGVSKRNRQVSGK